jgi:site-specific DNA recombinase
MTDLRAIALYCRVSTDEQTERQTIQGQIDFLRNWAVLFGVHVAGEYIDDGWSGTVPLAERPAGSRLLCDARAGRFTEVVVWRIDRLGRMLRVILDAHDALDRAGVTIRSATEPIDTSNAIGRFIFQLLASLAELERASITDRLTLGRDRVVRGGRWLGVVPLGYVVRDGALVPNETPVSALHEPECDLVRAMFERVAAGSSAAAEARYWTAIDMPMVRRYANGNEISLSRQWPYSRLNKILHNPVYKGEHTFASSRGPIVRAVPALVTPEVWDRVQARLLDNRALADKNSRHEYGLRGLIYCALCGRRYAGTASATRLGPIRVYRCGGQLSATTPDRANRCKGKSISADRLERVAWEWCKAQLADPSDILATLRTEAERQIGTGATTADQAGALRQQLATKTAEKARVVTLFRRDLLSQDEAERELGAINAEIVTLESALRALAGQDELQRGYADMVTSVEGLLRTLAASVEAAEGDSAARRVIVEGLIERIVIHTHGPGIRRGNIDIEIRGRYCSS